MNRRDFGKPVQICRPINEEGFEFDRGAFYEIFSHQDVAQTPVALYSLAGDFRKGKSFMLNLFLQHLRADLVSDSLKMMKETVEGFVAMGGFETCTKGIWIWNQPFLLKTDRAETIAVFLMDTQGIFDQEQNMKGCSVIFSLSTLISSMQIFNVMLQVQGSDLQHLELFVEYGKMAQRRENGMSCTPFQSLMFLVRYWPYYRQFDYGLEGGNGYLQDVLKRESRVREIQEVRENIKDSFEKIECFLLPDPGKKVRESQKGDPPVSLHVADKKFVDETQSLVNQLFTNGLRKKQVNGNDITGNDLIFLFGAYCDAFESGVMPQIDTIVEASAKARLVALLGEMREEYSKEVRKICDEGPLPPAKLSEHQDRVKSEILNQFHEQPKMGSGRLIESYEKDLKSLLDYQTLFFEQMNLANQHAKDLNKSKEEIAKMQEEFDKAQKELKELYNRTMSENKAPMENLQGLYSDLPRKFKKLKQGQCHIM